MAENSHTGEQVAVSGSEGMFVAGCLVGLPGYTAHCPLLRKLLAFASKQRAQAPVIP